MDIDGLDKSVTTYSTEDNAVYYCRGYNTTLKECPHSQETSRTSAKMLIAEFEKLNKNARASLLKAMSNINQQYLPKENGGEKE